MRTKKKEEYSPRICAINAKQRHSPKYHDRKITCEMKCLRKMVNETSHEIISSGDVSYISGPFLLHQRISVGEFIQGEKKMKNR